MERKFTDDEIVKAMECCCNNEDCIGCPCLDHGCYYEVKYSLDIINRQKAEIDRLQKEMEVQERMLDNEDFRIERKISEATAEAIKEFTERVKDIVDEPALIRGRVIDVMIAKIDNLVKEMTGENNGN